ncbi:hypothetical protein ABID82_003777 [Methylobacterium sp. PvP062]|nr:sigma-70 family RNA polymerase sigma factor [Methylobacterium radiotolerans]ONF45592.1 sigma-70 family RNA polymerase sigma factor [Methylobacterium radiotolerans]RUP17633.1 MAG: RNA polymerase subunit sigma-70 [Methylobacterium sp.]
MPNAQDIDRPLRSAAEHEVVISGSGIRSGTSLRQDFPEVADLDENSRLGRLLGRLSEAAAAAESEGQVPAGFGAALIEAVPDLRRRALTLIRDAIAGDVQGDDLVRLTLLKAWERRVEFRSGTGMPDRLVTILRSRPVSGRVAYRFAVPDPDDVRSAALHAGPAGTRAVNRHVC